MHNELHEFIITEIKNHIHDEILWRVRGTQFSDEEILKEVSLESDIKHLFAGAIIDNCYLPKDYKINKDSIKPVLEFVKTENLNELAPLIEEYATQTGLINFT